METGPISRMDRSETNVYKNLERKAKLTPSKNLTPLELIYYHHIYLRNLAAKQSEQYDVQFSSDEINWFKKQAVISKLYLSENSDEYPWETAIKPPGRWPDGLLPGEGIKVNVGKN